MIPTSFIIVADRGSLKAYKVEETPTRGPSLQLVQAFNLTEAHGRLQDRVSDHAGGFPVGDGGHRHMNGMAEKQTLEGESDRRIYRQLATQISEILGREKTAGWSFAAPAEIYTQITQLLPRGQQQLIVEHVKADLVKIEPAKLPAHFRSLHSV